MARIGGCESKSRGCVFEHFVRRVTRARRSGAMCRYLQSRVECSRTVSDSTYGAVCGVEMPLTWVSRKDDRSFLENDVLKSIDTRVVRGSLPSPREAAR